MGNKKGERGPHDRSIRPGAGDSHDKVVDLDHLEESLKMGDKYTENDEDEVASNVIQRHPNRNMNKPDIDKPPYS